LRTRQFLNSLHNHSQQIAASLFSRATPVKQFIPQPLLREVCIRSVYIRERSQRDRSESSNSLEHGGHLASSVCDGVGSTLLLTLTFADYRKLGGTSVFWRS